MLTFTGTIAVSTVIYTIYSIRLWKATRTSIDLARYAGFINLMTQLAAYASDAKQKGKPEAVLVEQMGAMIAEFGFDRFLQDIDFTKDKAAREYFSKIEGMLRGHNIDPDSVPVLKTAFRKMKQ